MVKRASGILPLRETVLIVALCNHPPLIDENFEAVETLDLVHPDLRRLHAALIDAMAHGVAHERRAVVESLERAGLAETWQRALELVRRARQWPALEDAAIEDARDAFAQALHLHHSARTLNRELKAAEAALAAEPTDENYRHLVEIQAQFRSVQATEALIEGFGVMSGRARQGS
jgi:DNA primase